MFIDRTTPWNGLGTVVTDTLSSEEAMIKAGLDWHVEQIPIIHAGQNSGYKMNVRSTDDKVLGVVGSRYNVVQNAHAFDFMDELLGEGIQYESAGGTANGKRIWLLAKMPETTILGDKTDPFMCLTNSHDGFGSLKVCMTPIRVACQNMLNYAFKRASRMWSVRHTGSIVNKMAVAQQTLGLATEYMEALDDVAEEFAKIKVSNSSFMGFMDSMFPVDDNMTARKEESQLQLRAQLKHAWEMDDLGNIRDNAWGLLTAVSDMATHKPPLRFTDNYKENSFMGLLDDPKLMDNAFKIISSM